MGNADHVITININVNKIDNTFFTINLHPCGAVPLPIKNISISILYYIGAHVKDFKHRLQLFHLQGQ